MSANKPNDRFENYVPVAERIEQFYDKHPDGRINTTILEHDAERGFILIRAEVFRNSDDAQPAATGHAYELRSEGYVNKTSYIENCETGACGRALALLGFEVKRGVASREEMQKAARMSQPKEQPAPVTPLKQRSPSDSQIVDLLGMLGKTEAGLNVWCQTNLKGFSGDWRDEPEETKRIIYGHFKAKLDKQAEGVK